MPSETYTCYDLKCDGCGKLLSHETELSYSDKDCLLQDAREEDWQILGTGENTEYYCPDCWSYDEDDNLVVKSTTHDK
jgi:hypothetical protein